MTASGLIKQLKAMRDDLAITSIPVWFIVQLVAIVLLSWILVLATL